MVFLRGGSIERCLTRLCAPTGAVRLEETRAHGIRGEDVAGLAPFADEWEAMTAARREGLLGCHFSGAESHLLKSVWPYPPPSPDFAKGRGTCNDWGPWIDTGRLHRNLYPDLASAGLSELVTVFELEDELAALAETHCPPDRRRFHAALYDALAGALLLVRLGRLPEFAGMTVGWLLRMSSGKERATGLAQKELW